MPQDVPLCDAEVDHWGGEFEILSRTAGLGVKVAPGLLQMYTIQSLNRLQLVVAPEVENDAPGIGEHGLISALLDMNSAAKGGGSKHILLREKEELSFFRVSVDLGGRIGRHFPPAARTCGGRRNAGVGPDVSLREHVLHVIVAR